MASIESGVFGGVGAHKDVQVAAAVDGAGRLLGAAAFDAGAEGCGRLAGWLESWGRVQRVGVEVASSLLIAAGDNPERMRSEAAFAALCGTSPIEAPSGATTRHRLNRGGNRQANNALWRIAMTRLRIDQKTIDYAARRTAEGKTRRETLRRLKRHIARETYKPLTGPPQIPRGADLRQQRTRSGLTTTTVAAAPNTPQTRISELERGLHHNNDLAHRYQQHLDQTPNRQT